ncbi:hypothetical protein OBO34_15405 [Clostridiales Family XIII bacterium ASD5510]|uniref:Uncharacterized protein n=1 Tax=Hominibacterium faecale TaxID=2839743 RepID=A0A9J6QV37_9FIRM|nr:hypothetical protein [Hominibacterium faecale]MCU7379732.1 hypothetical protein [Hominibacterium faecale]
MKNREKYGDEIIRTCINKTMCKEIIEHITLPAFELRCGMVDCRDCNTLLHMWLEEEYKEPETDWSKVAVDTPVFVKNHEDDIWFRRYFAKYENGEIYTFDCGGTSWSNRGNITSWQCAKLAELEGAE